MKNKYILSVFFICLIFTFAFSQQTIEVSATFQDSDGFPMSYALVIFEGKEDKGNFTEITADDLGFIQTEIIPGEYTMIVQPVSGGLITQEKSFTQNTQLGVVQLSNAIQLAEVVAKGEKPIYRIELDKRVYDMDRDPTARGASLSDALNNVPSVQVDTEGNVSVRGNGDVRILINGRPSSLSGISDPAQALRNLPADAVQRVEVVTNPSARYDAEGSAGVLNIVLKKGSNLGFNANINSFLGYRINNGVNANMNFKTDNWNFFFNPSVRFSQPKGTSEFDNRFFSDTGVDTLETQRGDRFRNRNRISLNLGTEYNWKEKNTITLSGNYNFSDGTNLRRLYYQDFAGTELYARSRRTEEEDESDQAFEANLGYKHEFDKEGHEFTFQSSASYAEEDELADITEQILQGVGEDSFDKSINNESQHRYLLQADYVKPIGEGGRFEAGYKSEWQNNFNDFTVQQLIDNQLVVNERFTDRVDFTQAIHAAYVQYGNKYGSFSYLAGLRVENTDIGIQSENANAGLGSNDEKNYTNLFPSATLNYLFDEEGENQLQMSYSRRIRRPRSWFLNPFFSFSDDRNTFTGNPDLDPVFTDSYELAYITQIGKVTITPSVYYQFQRDDINIVRERETFQGNEIFVARPVNAGNQERLGGELILSAQPFKFWRFFGNFNVFNFKTTGSYTSPITGIEYDFSGDGLSWFVRLNNTVNLPGKVDMQVNANYRGPETNFQRDRKSIFSMDLAFNKDLFKGNATLSLNISDVFNSRKRRITNFGEDFVSDIAFQWRERQFTLNFAYRINQKKQRERRGGGGFDGGDAGGY